MARNTGSKALHEVLYPKLAEEGSMSTFEIYDWMNNQMTDYKVGHNNRKEPRWRSRRSWTMNQIAQTLKVSHFFNKVGERREVGMTGSKRVVSLYEVVPINDVIEKIAGKRHTQQNYEKTLPSFAIDLYRKRRRELLGEDT
tara:strand:+ start:1866 stop:2288 length:423 start_codon:yes stop_codon:yes gene_type:complete